MISGKDLKKAGWKEGRALGQAKLVARTLASNRGLSTPEVMTALESCRSNPDLYVDDPTFRKLCETLIEDRNRARAGPPPKLGRPKAYPVWGPDLIDPGAIAQMDVAMSLPISVAGALMPDAHIGYGLPIGGVLETRDSVIPYAVGSDIACRMRLTVFDVDSRELDRVPTQFRNAIGKATIFGAGQENPDRPHHEVLDLDWSATQQLKQLREVAERQLGTSGSGNHFVEWGELEYVDAPGQTRVALLSHSGSRGVGFKIADRYSKLAEKLRKNDLPPEGIRLSWFDLDSAEGQEYWASMEIAGAFASANHEVIHEAVRKAIGWPRRSVLSVVENHHNWAWRVEQADGSVHVVHRKGATPAASGVMGVIPGSMAAPGFVVEGKGNRESLESASHGAGRRMGRREAERSLTKKDRDNLLVTQRVTLLGGGLDESPQAYKPIDSVMAAQRDLVEIRATFTPRIVRMADGGPDT